MIVPIPPKRISMYYPNWIIIIIINQKYELQYRTKSMYNMNVLQDTRKVSIMKIYQETTCRKLPKSKNTVLRTLGDRISHSFRWKQLKCKLYNHGFRYKCCLIILCIQPSSVYTDNNHWFKKYWNCSTIFSVNNRSLCQFMVII